MNKEYLSLTEYAERYGVSVSTLRRRIRAGRLPVSVKAGKYFLPASRAGINGNSAPPLYHDKVSKNVISSPAPRRSRHAVTSEELGRVAIPPAVRGSRHTVTSEELSRVEIPPAVRGHRHAVTSEELGRVAIPPAVRGRVATSPAVRGRGLEELVDKLTNAQELFCKQIEQKDKIISGQKDKIMDLKTLIALLEKENRELKSLLYEEKQMEEWLELR